MAGEGFEMKTTDKCPNCKKQRLIANTPHIAIWCGWCGSEYTYDGEVIQIRNTHLIRLNMEQRNMKYYKRRLAKTSPGVKQKSNTVIEPETKVEKREIAGRPLEPIKCGVGIPISK